MRQPRPTSPCHRKHLPCSSSSVRSRPPPGTGPGHFQPGQAEGCSGRAPEVGAAWVTVPDLNEGLVAVARQTQADGAFELVADGGFESVRHEFRDHGFCHVDKTAKPHSQSRCLVCSRAQDGAVGRAPSSRYVRRYIARVKAMKPGSFMRGAAPTPETRPPEHAWCPAVRGTASVWPLIVLSPPVSAPRAGRPGCHPSQGNTRHRGYCLYPHWQR